MFIIEDNFHAESLPEKYETFDRALEELIKISRIPYGQGPNIAPCSNIEGCERWYHILQYDDSTTPWKLLSDIEMLRMSPNEVKWILPCAESRSMGRNLSSALSWLIFYSKQMRKSFDPNIPSTYDKDEPLVETWDSYLEQVKQIAPDFYETFGGNS